MGTPSYQDANLMLKFLQWGSTSGVDEALNWLWSENFEDNYSQFEKKYPPGSKQYGYATKACGWYEAIGTLYKQGLFNEKLLFDWLAVRVRWNHLENFAKGLREKMGEPKMYENFEAMARVQKIK